MADQFSFDVVSEVNMQEMKNVVDQATKEIKQRFDFKDSKTEITLKEKEKELIVLSDDEVLHISTPDEVERFFSSAIDWFRSEDMVSARPELEHFEPISDRLVSLDVRWSTIDGSGTEDAAERCRYIVRVGDDGVPRIRVALIKGDERLEA